MLVLATQDNVELLEVSSIQLDISDMVTRVEVEWVKIDLNGFVMYFAE